MKHTRQAGVVLTMGTFDGIHRGHQSILRWTAQRAKSLGLRSLAMTFARPPRLHFAPQSGPQLLTSSFEKRELIRRFGIDDVLVYDFNGRLAGMSAGGFFRKYVLERFRAREIVVGYNFAFGKDREGTPGILKKLGEQRGIRVHVMPPFHVGGQSVSSGKIRRDIVLGRIGTANRKLGFPYFASGRVIRGQGIGRKLGYPTANVSVSADKILPQGVFAVGVSLPNGKQMGGMCNIGFHPTVGRSEAIALEVHVFDFNGDLVGKNIRIEFFKKLRAEKRFVELKALSAQLKRDEARSRRVLGLALKSG